MCVRRELAVTWICSCQIGQSHTAHKPEAPYTSGLQLAKKLIFRLDSVVLFYIFSWKWAKWAQNLTVESMLDP